MKLCSKCNKILDKIKFSKTQLKQTETKRKCINCLNANKLNDLSNENLIQHNYTQSI